jgi:predicted naringenin-chalcone synthase
VTIAYINRIATAVPPNDVHAAFLHFAKSLLPNPSRSALFERMAKKSEIEHRFSFFSPAENLSGPAIDRDNFYVRGNFPSTGARMQFFETHAPGLAEKAVDRLQLGGDRALITHLLVTCCTGLSAPGLDLEIVERCRLPATVERTLIGFMGCYAAINALKTARHIVRSEPHARVLVVNLELCTLHLQETHEFERLLSFLLWGDGCSACLVSAEPHGFELEDFCALIVPGSRELITWNVRDSGFDMLLSGQVPTIIQEAIKGGLVEILHGLPAEAIRLWAVHPGGRTVLDAVERAIGLAPAALSASREVLRRFGNMSSATVMFVLDALLRSASRGAAGCAMAFGPGLVAETMRFRAVGI